MKEKIITKIGNTLIIISIVGIIFFAVKGLGHMINYERSIDSKMYIEYMAAARSTLAVAGLIIAAEIGNSLSQFRKNR